MRRVAAVALLLLVAGCGSDEPPDVDWMQVPQSQRSTIERVVEAEDCAGMQAAFDGSEVADVLSYLDWHMDEAGCYQ